MVELKMKKRLLIFHPAIAPYRVDLFNALYHAFMTKVCLLRNNLISQKFDYEKIEGQFYFTPSYIGYESHMKYYIHNIRSFKPDIVLTNEFGLGTIVAILYRLLAHTKYRLVCICDDSYDMIVNDNDFSWKHRIARRIITPLLDELILVEPNVVAWYQQHYHKGVWFPIIRDDDKARRNYERLLPESQKIVDKYHLAGKHVFLFVGRLVALKNVRSIIKAFKKLDNPNSVLVIIGSGEEEGNLHKEAQGMVNVIFTGRLEGDELYKWYNVATAFILASYQEPFGAVTNEALLAGCWAIISDKAGSRCLVKPGVNGDTFNPMNVESLTNKMRYVCLKLPMIPDKIKLKQNGMVYSFNNLILNVINTLNKNDI